MPEQISELTINRLSLYLRFLNELESRGVKTVSSKVLAEQFGFTVENLVAIANEMMDTVA